MNERIRELAHEAGFVDYSVHNRIESKEQVLEKFAELIVKEVFAKIEDERFDVYEPVIDSVMQHFGVE